MKQGVAFSYEPSTAAAVEAQVRTQDFKASAPLHFTRGALGQWLASMCFSAEQAAIAAKFRQPDNGSIGIAEDAAREAYEDEGTDEGDVITGVSPRVAVSWCYLATAASVKRVLLTKRIGTGAAAITHKVGELGPAPTTTTTIPIPGLPIPVPAGFPSIPGVGIPGFTLPEGTPPLVIPGVGFADEQMGFSVPAGVLALVGFGFAAAAAAYVARDALVATEVEATKRRDIEVAAQVKLATDICAANAALGVPCDVPEVVRNLAKEEHRTGTFWKYGVPAIGVGVVGAAGFTLAKKAGWL